MSYLTFISNKDLKEIIVIEVANTYKRVLKGYDLKEFYKNKVDPIKFIFDSKFYRKDIESVIEDELQRQRDKSVSNSVGRFHQNIFKYINGWYVPNKGFDIINNENTVFVELKNKHNTMNSSSASKTYMKMLDKIAKDPSFKCYLVEVIANSCQNIPWSISVDGQLMVNERIRRVSLDNFYSIVTGVPNAFKLLCDALPSAIDEILIDFPHEYNKKDDTVIQELKSLNSDILEQLFKDTFHGYNGF